MRLSARTIKNIVNGKWEIYEEHEECRYVYYTQMAFTHSYDEYYFYNDEKSFRLSEYKKKWRIQK